MLWQQEQHMMLHDYSRGQHLCYVYSCRHLYLVDGQRWWNHQRTNY